MQLERRNRDPLDRRVVGCEVDIARSSTKRLERRNRWLLDRPVVGREVDETIKA